MKRRPKTFIQDARKFFVDRNNQPDAYYALRAEFNASSDPYYRSLLFLYMNRHGYNGLCRYNSKGIFNVPFGDYRKPYFPEKELEHFAEKARKAKFICRPFEQVFRRARQGDVIYCDPPYAPLVQASNFTGYATGGFGLTDQHELARRAAQVAKKRDIPVLISNHDTELTRITSKRILAACRCRAVLVKRVTAVNPLPSCWLSIIPSRQPATSFLLIRH